MNDFLPPPSRMPPPHEPRTISEYFLAFRKALEKEFDVEDPGRSEQPYLVADHIGTKNKRQLTLYISPTDPDKAKKYIRVSYKLPVSAEGAPLFGGDGDEILPSEGPTFQEVDVPHDSTVVAEITKHLRDEAPWASEIERVRGVYESTDDAKKKRAAKNILVFWKEMREKVYDEVYYISIRIRRRLSGGPAESLTPRARSTRRSSRNKRSHPRAVSASPSPKESRTATVRTNSTYQRSTTRTSRQKPNSDPSVPRLPRDPVTGKIIRRRRPDSDPKNEEEED